tara:strand:- start:8521 stop:9378 length:858 start_codon:yes stop_codon:yes gene_type:complete
MSETNTPVTETAESTTESAPSTEATDEASSTVEEAAPSAKSDTYEDRIEGLLKAAEAERQGKEVEAEALREGESWNDIYKRQDPEVQRAMQSLRKDYTQKTQEVSKQRKEAKAEMDKALQLQKSLYESDAYKNLQELSEESGEEFDPFDPDSFKKYVEKAVAKRLKDVLEPMYAEQQKVSTRSKLNKFMDEHSELRTDEAFKGEVKEVLLADKNLNLEQAYWIVHGKRSRKESKKSQMADENRKRAARAAGLRIGNGRKAGMTAPPETKGMKAAEIYDYLLSQQK